MIWKARTEKLGNHIHATLFCASDADKTYASVGTLIMIADEWKDFASRVPFAEIPSDEETARKWVSVKNGELG